MAVYFSFAMLNSPRLTRRCASRFLFKRYLAVLHGLIPRFGFFWIFFVGIIDFFSRVIVEFKFGKTHFSAANLWLERAALEYFRLQIVVYELGWCIAPMLRNMLVYSFLSASPLRKVEAGKKSARKHARRKTRKHWRSSSPTASMKEASLGSPVSLGIWLLAKVVVSSFCGTLFWCCCPLVYSVAILLGITFFREVSSFVYSQISRQFLTKRNSDFFMFSLLSFSRRWPLFFCVVDGCILVLWTAGVVTVGLFYSGAEAFLWDEVFRPLLSVLISFFSTAKRGTSEFLLSRTLCSVVVGGLCTSFVALQWIRTPLFSLLRGRSISRRIFENAPKRVKRVFADDCLLNWNSEEARDLSKMIKKETRNDLHDKNYILSPRRLRYYVLVVSAWTIASVSLHIFPSFFSIGLAMLVWAGGAMILSILLFWVLPAVVAKFIFFSFVREVTELKIGGPLEEIYTSGKEQGISPCFLSPFFVFGVSALIGKLCNIFGVFLFYGVFWKCNYRLVFSTVILLGMITSVFCHLTVLSSWRKWNQKSGVSADYLSFNTGENRLFPVDYLSWIPLSENALYLCSTLFLQLFHSLAWVPFGVMQDALLPPTASRHKKRFLILQNLVNLYVYFGMAVCSDLTGYFLKKVPLRITVGSTSDLFEFNYDNMLVFVMLGSLLPGICLLPLVWWSVPGEVVVGDEISYP